MYPFTHQYLTFHWLSVGDEEGQTGLRLSGSNVLDLSDVTAIANATSTFWTTVNNAIPNQFRLYRVKAALVDANGNYPSGSEAVVYDFPTPVSGTGGALMFPLQTAAVTSLLGANPRSSAGRGRMYLPPINKALTVGAGTWGTTDVSNRATSVVSWLNAIAALTTPIVPAILSATGAGAMQEVDSIRQGNRPDVQRRRAAQQPETYTDLPL